MTEIHGIVSETEMPTEVKAYLLRQLAEIEQAAAVGANERIQMGALVGSFQMSRGLVK